MLKSPRAVPFKQENLDTKSYQYVLFNNLRKRNQWYEQMVRAKYRLEKTAPNMQHVIQADMERMKTNQVYQRKLNRDLNGPKGLSWQCRQELQRLRSDERGVERDLVRLNREMTKLTTLPPINRSPTLSQTQSSRLSSIAEENSSISVFDQPKINLRRSSTTHTSRNLIPIRKQPSLRKPPLQHLIAKTSDDRQPHAHLIEEQKRFVEQRLKRFLH